ncbi:MAG: 2'-5' RNA ligase family protein [Patescibacteria group bacterium]
MSYFIGYRLKGSDEAAVEALRREISEKFDVHAALKIPPHFTLFYPFDFSGPAILEQTLVDVAQGQRPFSIQISSFASFPPRVWFIDVGVGTAQDLRDAVKLAMSGLGVHEDKVFPEPSHYHITLAYKDLTPESFEQIGKRLSERPVPIRGLDIDSITLFEKRADSWFAIRDFPFAA